MLFSGHSQPEIGVEVFRLGAQGIFLGDASEATVVRAWVNGKQSVSISFSEDAQNIENRLIPLFVSSTIKPI